MKPNYLNHLISLTAGFLLLSSAMTAAQAATKHSEVSAPTAPTTVDVAIKPVYGRKEAEYFFTPIIGINYEDVTQIAYSFFQPEVNKLQNNNDVSATRTSLGGTIGLLVDGQYQIISTDSWRAGFQTGLVYTSKTDSAFTAFICPVATPCSTASNQDGTFEHSSIELPVMFTFSRYADNDRYIITVKLGPVVSYEMYNINFAGFDTSPSHETQVNIGLGLDGRYRIKDSDNFFLIGFTTGSPFGNGNNNSFSGVNNTSKFTMYVGVSFS